MTAREEIAAVFEPAFAALASAQVAAVVDAYLAERMTDDTWTDHVDAVTAAAAQHMEEIEC